MRWLKWYVTRANILTAVFAVVVICLCALVLVRFPTFHQATGFGPDWDCQVMPKGDPVCSKRPSR
jgi:hypothetical protein